MDSLTTLHDKIDRETSALEEQMLGNRPWHLKGEVYAVDRDEDALLDQHLDVQRHGKFKPPPANEEAIVEFLKKAIKEQAFDSPVFKSKDQLPPVGASAAKLDLSRQQQQGEQRSLVDDYADLFKINKVLDVDQVDPVKNEIQSQMRDLFARLDELVSFRPTKKQAVPEIKVIQSRPALALEEAGPTASANVDLLAPEEIHAPRGELLIGSSEKTAGDRRRHRRKLQRIRHGRGQGSTDSKEAAAVRLRRMADKPQSRIRIVK